MRSWIQGHPEYGFDFKALVGHDGVRHGAHLSPFQINAYLLQVFDSNYNGYSTDELFFVCYLAVGKLHQVYSLVIPIQFNHEWGGRPWDNKSKALSEK